LFTVQLEENDIASECQCLISPMDKMKSLFNDPSPKTFEMGQYVVQWKRYLLSHDLWW